jgi:hypothetical protein
MASAETWVLNLLGAASYAAGAYVGVKYVLPLVRGLLADVVKYGKAVNSFIGLLTILLYVVAAKGVVERLVAIGDKPLTFLTVVNPAIEVLENLFFPTLRLLVIGVGILILAERIRLR